MKLGVFSMLAHPPHRGYADVVEEDLEMLVLADELGFSEAWLGEHFTSIWENIPAPDLLIAQALRCTKRIKLATGVSSIPNHNPAQLANRIAQLDQMARGRFLWGAGAVPSDAYSTNSGSWEVRGRLPTGSQTYTPTRAVTEAC